MTNARNLAELNTFVKVADTAIASAIAWTGTAPSGASSLRYRATRIGTLVLLEMRLEYATAGATNTKVTIDFPAGLPTPEVMTGAADEVQLAAAGAISTTPTADPVATQAWIARSSGTYQMVIAAASGAYRLATAFAFYRTADA